jgi:hypothetical protein
MGGDGAAWVNVVVERQQREWKTVRGESGGWRGEISFHLPLKKHGRHPCDPQEASAGSSVTGCSGVQSHVPPSQRCSGTVARCSIRLEASDSPLLSERLADTKDGETRPTELQAACEKLYRWHFRVGRCKHKLPAARSLPESVGAKGGKRHRPINRHPIQSPGRCRSSFESHPRRILLRPADR